MDAILKFKQAAKDLQSDERYLAFQAARAANDADTELQSQLGEFNLLRMDVNNEMEKNDRDDVRLSELNMRINELYNSIMQNKNMLAYNSAKAGIESFIDYVNLILNAAISGEDPLLVEEPTQDEGCGGSCSSCAGCH